MMSAKRLKAERKDDCYINMGPGPVVKFFDSGRIEWPDGRVTWGKVCEFDDSPPEWWGMWDLTLDMLMRKIEPLEDDEIIWDDGPIENWRNL